MRFRITGFDPHIGHIPRSIEKAKAEKPEPDVASPEQVAAILEKAGHRKMVDEAAAEKKKPESESSRRMRERANAAAMETLRRQRGEPVPTVEEQAAEAGG